MDSIIFILNCKAAKKAAEEKELLKREQEALKNPRKSSIFLMSLLAAVSLTSNK